MSENEYWQLVRDKASAYDGSDMTNQQISRSIVHEVESAADDGQAWAVEVLGRWSERGAAADYKHVVKDRNDVIYIRADGSKIRKTVAYSRPVRSKQTAEIIGRQMQAWWDMSRAAVVTLRQEMFDRGERITDVVEALDQIIAAMDRHPQCATAREAWEADGHDLAEIELDMTGT